MQKWKKLAALLLALTLVCGLLPAALAEETEPAAETPAEAPAEALAELGFTDLTGAEVYADIAYVSQNGLMSGVGDGKFDPEGQLTRAMVVTVLHRLAGKPTTADRSSFTDVPADAYYAEAVNWAAAKGLVVGVSSDAFAPNQPITREQLATLCFRYVQWATNKPYDGTNGYLACRMHYGTSRDQIPVPGSMQIPSRPKPLLPLRLCYDFVDISEDAQPAVIWALDERLMQEHENAMFEPKAPATRAETATALARLSGVLGLRPDAFRTVTFLMNDGTNRIYLVRHVMVGETVEEPRPPEGLDAGVYKTNFSSWFNGDIRTGSRYDFSTPVTEDLKLNALWRGTNSRPF